MDFIQRTLHTRIQRWLNRRIQPAKFFCLRNRSLFIFPTATGFGFLTFVALLWLLGTNYSNNLILSLAFLLVALMVVSILHAFANLYGLTLNVQGSEPCFLGETGRVQLAVGSGSKHREAIRLGFTLQESVLVDLRPEQTQTLDIPVTPDHRGYFTPQRLRVESLFPLGLIRCWTLLKLDVGILVYPQPMASIAPPLTGLREGGGEGGESTEGGDVNGFRALQSGEGLAGVAWKRYAKTGDLLKFTRESAQASGFWLDWEALQGLSREARLSILCHWVQHYHNKGVAVGLNLPGEVIQPESSPLHTAYLLQTLALYQWQDAASKGAGV